MYFVVAVEASKLQNSGKEGSEPSEYQISILLLISVKTD